MARAKKQTDETTQPREEVAEASHVPAGMTELVANRNFTLSTREGHSIRFQEGVPKLVSNKLVPEAMRYGAMPTDPAKLEKPDEGDNSPAPEGGDRQVAIKNAIEVVVKRNDRNDFGANSRPKVEAVSKVANFEVHEKELSALWESMGN